MEKQLLALNTEVDRSLVFTVSGRTRLSEDLKSGAGVQVSTHNHVVGWDRSENKPIAELMDCDFNMELLLREKRTTLTGIGNDLLTSALSE